VDRADPSDDGDTAPAVEQRLETAARDPHEGSEARRLLVEFLTDQHCDGIGDAALVFSELVTNAVLHGGGAVRISACLADDGRHLLVEVQDNEAAAPVPAVGGPNGGFGLQIIEQLSERWGITPTADGKVVWAVLRSGIDGTRAG